MQSVSLFILLWQRKSCENLSIGNVLILTKVGLRSRGWCAIVGEIRKGKVSKIDYGKFERTIACARLF